MKNPNLFRLVIATCAVALTLAFCYLALCFRFVPVTSSRPIFVLDRLTGTVALPGFELVLQWDGPAKLGGETIGRTQENPSEK